ncbi:MAG: hypothetical protein ACLT75_09390 [Alistipes putredinis]
MYTMWADTPPAKCRNTTCSAGFFDVGAGELQDDWYGFLIS